MHYINKNNNQLLITSEDIKYYEQLILLIKTDQFNYSKKILADNNLYQWIMLKTSILKNTKTFKYKISTRCFWICNGLLDFPRCQTCGKIIGFEKHIKIKKGYPTYCSNQCIGTNKNIQQQKQNTCLKNFNVVWPMQSNEIKNKSIKTCNLKYGVNYYNQTELFKEQFKQTCIGHYGVDHNMKSEIGKNNYKKSILNIYGVDNVAKNKNIKKKICETNIKRYGVAYAQQNPFIRHKGQFKYIYDNRKFDSSNEIAYYIYLTDYKINFIYQPEKSFEYICNNKIHKYIPDFYLTDLDQYIEIKGRQFFKPDGTMYCPYRGKNMSDDEYQQLNNIVEAKHQCMIKNNIKIIRSNSDEMQNIMKYINQKYGKNYLQQFKNTKHYK